MKVFISCALFYPSKLGGPANTLYWLAKGLVAKGHRVYVVSTHNHIDNASIPFDKETIVDGINVIYSSSRYKLISHSYQIMKKCDTIILSSVCYSPELILAVLAKRMNKPVIWSPRGEFTESAIGGRKTKLVFFKLIKTLVGKYVIFHGTSQDEECCIKQILGESVQTTIIPNYMEIPERQERKAIDSPYFLFLGRIAPIKAIENLIKGASLSSLFLQSNVLLKIAGGVEDQFRNYYEKLQELVKETGLQDKVEFIGGVSGTTKYQTYCDAKFLFLVSKSENFGNVVIEALSQGTPVVASHGTPWEDLIENHAGYWIENSPEEISATIDRILSLSPEAYNQYREGALAYAEKFNIYSNTDKWEEVLSRKF